MDKKIMEKIMQDTMSLCVCVFVSCESMTLWWWGWIVNGVEEKGAI